MKINIPFYDIIKSIQIKNAVISLDKEILNNKLPADTIKYLENQITYLNKSETKIMNTNKVIEVILLFVIEHLSSKLINIMLEVGIEFFCENYKSSPLFNIICEN
ncbi:hypothetical protein [Cytobacillus kochii]|uniref:hypothetical protein n=1 Tax=Cytobacillus kochii TaxID=859143 RepID=UPI00203F693A|nr:hypothetical protein [Cytobacillus kochii]MCM3324751.1 hypothetical protein [Cytobacillus kochii]MCM3347144.1 hypothetical protein [Cytobacillus kochii]